MKKQKNIGKIVALSLGSALILGSGIYFLVIYLKSRNQAAESEDKASAPSNTGNGSSAGQTASKYTTEHIKRMQSYLLNLGMSNSNNDIIDAIQLTGGVDGVIGDGFRFALSTAIEKGYLNSEQQLAALTT